jgi:hypothetical protein
MVNVPSRVESLNKELATEIFITDIVLQQIAGEVDADDKGERFVKSREHPVRVYTVSGWKTKPKGVSPMLGCALVVRSIVGSATSEEHPASVRTTEVVRPA